jgi:hypothetical protein
MQYKVFYFSKKEKVWILFGIYNDINTAMKRINEVKKSSDVAKKINFNIIGLEGCNV